MKKDLIDVLVIDKPQDMEYQLTISNEREKTKIVKRMERMFNEHHTRTPYRTGGADSIKFPATVDKVNTL